MTHSLSLYLAPYLDPDATSVVLAYSGLDELVYLRSQLMPGGAHAYWNLWAQYQFARDPLCDPEDYPKASARFLEAARQARQERLQLEAAFEPDDETTFEARFARALERLWSRQITIQHGLHRSGIPSRTADVRLLGYRPFMQNIYIKQNIIKYKIYNHTQKCVYIDPM